MPATRTRYAARSSTTPPGSWNASAHRPPTRASPSRSRPTCPTSDRWWSSVGGPNAKCCTVPRLGTSPTNSGCSCPGTGNPRRVVGALSAIGLQLSGDDGLFITLPGLADLPHAATVDELLASVPIDEARDGGNRRPAAGERIELGDWVRPVLLGAPLCSCWNHLSSNPMGGATGGPHRGRSSRSIEVLPQLREDRPTR